jgi:hypothetical protein
MHQPVIAIDPRDVDVDLPFCEMPFAKWLATTRESRFIDAIKAYFGLTDMPLGFYQGFMTTEQITTMRHCHSATWFLMHRKTA